MVAMIQVGFSKTDITPPMGRPLGRLFQNDMVAEGVEWPLYVSCMAIDDGDGRAVILSFDKNRLLDPGVAEILQATAEATDVPPGRIFTACTHAHNVPFATDWLPGDRSGFAYLDVLKAAAAQAAHEALGALQPARLFTARASAPGFCVNRRPVYRTDRGEQVGTHGPTDHPDFLRMEGPADDELLLLVAEADDGETLGGIVNFGCHTTTMYGVPVWSADFPGPLREALAHDVGGTFLYLTGAAGNIAPNPKVLRGHKGAGRARVAVRALQSKQPLAPGRLSVRQKVLRIPQRRPTAKQIELARQFLEDCGKADLRDFCRQLYGYTYTMFNASERFQEWLCRELLGMWEWQRRRAVREPADDVDIRVVTLGDFALLGFPSEIFCEFGLQVKQESPLAFTMVAELANGWHGYIPPADAFERGGFETSFAYQSHLVPDAGERMIAAALALLAEAAKPDG